MRRTTISILNKGFILTGLVILNAAALQAQSGNLKFQTALQFDTTLTTARDSSKAWLLWKGTSALTLDSAIVFPVAGLGSAMTTELIGRPFQVQGLPLDLQPNVADSLAVKFAPRHNIDHNSEVVICSGALPGCISVDVRGRGRYTEAYYKATENLSEQALRDRLKAIITAGYTQLGYNGARDRMFMDIDNKRVNGEGAAQNTLECVYTGRLAVGYTNRTDAQGAPYGMNTEHTMPQSTFGSANPMQSDIHHLFVTDNVANSTRSNWPFDTVPNPTTTLLGGSLYGGGIFEPRDVHKGRGARALLYFATRYQDYNGFIAGHEAALRRWSRNRPPLAQEVKRNDLAQQYQRNRNPYSDHNELIERISSIAGTTTSAPQLNTFRYFPTAAENLSVRVGDTLRIYVAIVNTGNQSMTLTDPVYPSLEWTVEDVAVPPTIEPGEAFNGILQFVPTSGGRVVGNLTFNVLQGTVPAVRIQIPLSVDVITAVASSLSSQVRVWPTVFTSGIQFSAYQPSSVMLLDLQGRPMWKGTGLTSGTIPTGQLSAGSYLIRVASPQGVRTFTVVK